MSSTRRIDNALSSLITAIGSWDRCLEDLPEDWPGREKLEADRRRIGITVFEQFRMRRSMAESTED